MLAIRRIWRDERHDWEDSLPRIYEATLAKRWFTISDATRDTDEDIDLIDTAAKEHNVPTLLLRKLIDAERRAQGLRRRSDIYKQLNQILDQDWRDDATIATDLATLEA